MATPPSNGEFERDVVVIGGGGHVGLPLAIAFADRGARVAIYDVSEDAVARVNAARLPFDEPGAAPLLERAVAAGRLTASTDPAAPFGGVKQSGLGREGAHEGLLEYTETKYIATDW